MSFIIFKAETFQLNIMDCKHHKYTYPDYKVENQGLEFFIDQNMCLRVEKPSWKYEFRHIRSIAGFMGCFKFQKFV